jgi:hypothetical protein
MTQKTLLLTSGLQVPLNTTDPGYFHFLTLVLVMAVLEDVFTVSAVDPDGKVFDRGRKEQKYNIN